MGEKTQMLHVKNIQIIFVDILPLCRLSIISHFLSSYSCSVEGSKENYITVEKPDEHYLSQVVKIIMNYDGMFIECTLICYDEMARCLCGLSSQNA